MKVIYVPGFWDSPDKFEVFASIMGSHQVEYRILDYRKFKSYAKELNADVFAKMLNEVSNDDFGETILISYSMGASFVYDYLKSHYIKPAKLIFINPLIENVGNSFKSSYYRVLDMYKQGQLLMALQSTFTGLIPLADVALVQQNYNKKIKFDKKINLDATFIWSDKDLICPIRNYENYKSLFDSSELVIVPNHHHNWLVYKEPIEKFLVPLIKL